MNLFLAAKVTPFFTVSLQYFFSVAIVSYFFDNVMHVYNEF